MKKLMILVAMVFLQNAGYSANYAGRYTGTYSGSDTGTWQVTADESGNIVGSSYSNSDKEFVNVTGTILDDGTAYISIATGAECTGKVNAAGQLAGTWKNRYYGFSGTFKGQRKPIQLTVINGSGSGLYVSGTKVTIRATVPVGMKFFEWNEGNTNVSRIITMPSAPVTYTANFTDIQKPAVKITVPVVNQRIVTNGQFLVKGTASDNKAVAEVRVQLNGGAWTKAVGTNVWSLPVTLSPGSNTVCAYGADMTGNCSLTSRVVCTYVVTGNLTVQTNGPGTVARTPTGAPEVGKVYTLAAAPKAGFGFKEWTDGDGAVISTNKVLKFAMTSNKVFTANFTDIQKPVVTITAPTASLRISNAVYTIKGAASDNGAVTNVYCRVNSGAWTNAVTTNSWKNWSVPVVLAAGSNLIQACGADSDGNVSAFTNVSCIYVVTDTLTVQTTGSGTVTPDLNGQPLEIGKKYTLTAKPDAGHAFVNWSYGIDGETAVSAITFTMQSNLVLAANFINSQKLSEDGLNALSEFFNTNSVLYGAAKQISDAAAAFDLAARSNPNNYTNRICNAVAIMFNLVNNPALRSQADACGLNLDDLLNPACLFPTNAPAVNNLVDTFAVAVLPAIDKAWTELNAVPATWTGQIEISTNRFPVDEAVWVDIGDVTVMKAALKGFRAFIEILKAYSLNVNYARLLDPVATPRTEITAEGSVADWTNVPRSLITFDYPDEPGDPATVTQEVAVALNGSQIALLMTGCPFGLSDGFWTGFELRLSDGDAINSNRCISVDLWTSEGTIYGMADGQPLTGLETALLNGVLEVKFDVTDNLPLSQVTIDEVGCGMDKGEGYWEDVFWLSPPEDTPIRILLASHPEFLSRIRNTASMAGAKTNLQAALNGYLSADTLIAKRSGVNAGLLHLIDFDPSDEESNQARLEARANVQKILTSLTSPVQIMDETGNAATPPFLLGAFFKSPYITTNVLPSGLRGTINNPSWNAFPNPTFNGMLPGTTSSNLNIYLLGRTLAGVRTDYEVNSQTRRLQFWAVTMRRNMTITGVMVTGPGLPTEGERLETYYENNWATSCELSPSPAAGAQYAFIIEYADRSRETLYDKVVWITAPAPVISGTLLKWPAVLNANQYVVWIDAEQGWYPPTMLPITKTALDLSQFGFESGQTYWLTVEVYNKHGDRAGSRRIEYTVGEPATPI